MSRRSERIRDERESIYNEQDGLCATCCLPVSLQEGELAHKIPDTVWAREKWGFRVIDHRLNKALTHRGFCNDQQNIQNRPIACEHLVAAIRKELKGEG